MSILNKSYIVTMPNGERWSVPVMAIAEHRAKHFAMQHGGNVRKSYQEDTKPFFEADSDNIEYWAQNGMNWADVSDKTTLVNAGKRDYQKGWVHGPNEIK